MKARAGALSALVAIGCGGVSRNLEPGPAAAAAERVARDSFAEWSQLARLELVWTRPDLAANCRRGELAYFLPDVTSARHAHALIATELGCQLLRAGTFTPEGSDSFAGAAFCCPRDLPPAPAPHTGGGVSCEQARDEILADPLDVGDEDRANISAEAYGAILNRGSYFVHCGVPDTTSIDICVAVVDGEPAGVTVRTSPVEAKAADCIAAAVQQLKFPEDPRLDIARTHF